MGYLLLKSFHLMAVVTWFAALFYLPRLFVYHTLAQAEGDIRGAERFQVMERKLYRGIMMPSLVAVLFFGGLLVWMLPGYLMQTWLHIKLLLVVLLVIYHFWCGHLVQVFAQNQNTRTHLWYRVFNELPVFGLILIVLLAVLKPW